MIVKGNSRATIYEQCSMRNLPPQIMLKGRDRLGIVMTVGDIARELFEGMYRRMDETEKHYISWDAEDKLKVCGDAVENAHLAGFGYIADRPAGFAFVRRVNSHCDTFAAHFWFGRGILRDHALRIIRGFMGELAPCFLMAEIPAPYRQAREFISRAGFAELCVIPKTAWLAHKARLYDMHCYGYRNKPERGKPVRAARGSKGGKQEAMFHGEHR